MNLDTHMLTRLRLAVEQARQNNVHRLVCPVCNGGSSQEKSLGIWQGGKAVTCYRATCPLGTVFLEKSEGTIPVSSQAAPIFNPYTGKLKQLRKNSLGWQELVTKYNLSSKAIARYCRGVYHGDLGGQILFKWSDLTGKHIGWISRKGKHKINYRHTTGPRWAAYTQSLPQQVWLVEDCISALRIWDYDHGAVALLGTILTTADQASLLQQLPSTVKRLVIALDADTWYTERPTALKLYRQLNPHLPDVRPIFIECDIKDMHPDQLGRLMT